MAYPQGIAFRNDPAFVTDPSGVNAEHAGGALSTGVTYPRTTTQGNTVGWLVNSASGINCRDRDNSINPKLAGCHWLQSGESATYEFDITPGAYNIRVAGGDYANNSYCKVEVFDDTASLGVLCNGATTAGNLIDASGAVLSAAAWEGSNTAVTKTFSSTKCKLVLGGVAGQFSSWAFVSLESASTDPTITTVSPAIEGDTLVISGINFGATQGSKSVKVGGVTQTVSLWSATEVRVSNLAIGSNNYGTSINVELWNGASLFSNSFAVAAGFQPPSGWAYVNVGTLFSDASKRLTFTGSTPEQVVYQSPSVTLFPNLTFVVIPGISYFMARGWTAADGWGALGAQKVGSNTRPGQFDPEINLKAWF